MVNAMEMCAIANLVINWNRIENSVFRNAVKDVCMVKISQYSKCISWLIFNIFQEIALNQTYALVMLVIS